MDERAPSTDKWLGGKRIAGLWRFAIAISILNILGHTVLGFEQAWAHPFVALAAAYGMEVSIEVIDALARHRRPRCFGSPLTLIEFLLPAHITGLAVSMLLYPNQRFWVMAFAAGTAVASKTLFRAPVVVDAAAPGGWPRRHFLNPSNFGITLTLLCFPTVGIAQPYQFTENVRGPLDVILPLLIVLSGSILNTKFTERIPLIAAWLGSFILQALVRSWLFGLPPAAALLPMTGLAFVLFTFYMVTDPGTTPSKRTAQIIFGAAVAIVYGTLVSYHVVFGLFFALTIVTTARGIGMYWAAFRTAARTAMVHGIVDPGTAGVSALPSSEWRAVPRR